jgi:hypothetical protein
MLRASKSKASTCLEWRAARVRCIVM